MIFAGQRWQPEDLRCSGCDAHLTVQRREGTAAAGAGILPDIPGAVCESCLPLAAGPAITDLKAAAAAGLLQSLAFESRTEKAVQFFLDLFGWQREVVASGAMRLHADGKAPAAYRLLAAAAKADPQPYYLVEEASLRLLDGETGRAHDLLLASGAQDHPCWHLHRGTLAFSVGRGDAALEHWRSQVAERPEEPLGWQTLGYHLLQDLGDLPAAIRHFQQAVERFPRHPEFADWLRQAQERLAHERRAEHG